MSAMGFGQNVTGAGSNPQTINVTNGNTSGEGSLRRALNQAESIPAGKTGTMIVLAANLTIGDDDSQMKVKAKNVTITGPKSSKIGNNLLYFDCASSDNVILQNLTFQGGDSGDETSLRDTIKLDATVGRGPLGFWIDRCLFEAYYDLNFTSNAADAPLGSPLPPLLITISNCLFRNDHPQGSHHENNGAVGIHGFTDESTRNRKTNAFATIYNNYFDHVRRRSPRSSGLCYVHAFNNVLVAWGAAKTDFQVTGMESGHDGRLAAQANYFVADAVKETIGVSTTAGMPGFLTIDDGDTSPVKNLYRNGAIPTPPAGTALNLTKAYSGVHVAYPLVQPMTDELGLQLRSAAGPQ